MSTIDVGFALPEREFAITRADLIQYAGASGDFNVIHWNERVAREVGLPTVIAHGMYTMGVAVRIVTEWLNNPAAVVEYSCRFTRPVPVPDDNVGARLVVNAQVTELLPENRAVLSLTATCDSVAVLGKARVVVQLPA
ncbi:MAG: MaoC family dehydratase N-terminal domain-containing protein [Candidatus Nanopelagicales bacterium]|nr:MaoC family dehydratase N-terminal domain-containing protein [Candidatus Nanopelagicales bacterium]MCF8551598.1 MaoC family dehydratase N-terminal domain-containing protein [Candidatus Nanopelagicales bacterium]